MPLPNSGNIALSEIELEFPSAGSGLLAAKTAAESAGWVLPTNPALTDFRGLYKYTLQFTSHSISSGSSYGGVEFKSYGDLETEAYSIGQQNWIVSSISNEWIDENNKIANIGNDFEIQYKQPPSGTQGLQVKRNGVELGVFAPDTWSAWYSLSSSLLFFLTISPTYPSSSRFGSMEIQIRDVNQTNIIWNSLSISVQK